MTASKGVRGPLSVRELIGHIPKDGCILVFNGSNAHWAQHANATGVLRCRVLDTSQKYQAKRDLRISWRDE